MPWFAVAAGLAMNVVGQKQQADELNTRAEFQETALENQQRNAVEQQSIAAADRDARLKRVLATQRAMFGAGGVDPTSGSAAAVRSGSIGEAAREQVSFDALYQREESARQSQSDAIKQQKNNIDSARNIGIGSVIANSAVRYGSI